MLISPTSAGSGMWWGGSTPCASANHPPFHYCHVFLLLLLVLLMCSFGWDLVPLLWSGSWGDSDTCHGLWKVQGRSQNWEQQSYGRQDGSVVKIKIKWHTPLSKRVRAYCEWQSLSMRYIRFRFDGSQSMKQTHLYSWKWRMKIQWMCSGSRQEVSTKRGTCYFTPDLGSSRTKRHSFSENHHLVPPHPDYYSTVFSVLSFLAFCLLYCTLTNICAQAFSFFKTKWAVVCFDGNRKGKNTSFLH